MMKFRSISRILSVVLLLPASCAAFASEPNTLTQEEKNQGFVLLFDGKELSPELWQGNIAGYPVKDGIFYCGPKGGALLTKQAYSDFVFRFDVKLPPAGNNGVAMWAEGPGKDLSFEHGIEIQILDNFAEKYKNLKEYQFNGSLYGLQGAKRNPEKNDYLKPTGQWNAMEVVVKGTLVKVHINDETILEADLAELRKKPTLSGKPQKGMFRDHGFIGFLGHRDPVEFRSVRIQGKPAP